MNQTEDIKDLVAALCKAQGMMKPAIFNKKNPHFKSRYADFTSVMDACRDPLSSNGLAVMQFCETHNEKLMLVTMIAHTSGQWIKSYLPLVPRNMDSQSIGSAITYAKRYSLSAMLGIVCDDDEDDDAETAEGRGHHMENVPSIPLISKDQASYLHNLISQMNQETVNALWNYLKSPEVGIKTIKDLPASKFEGVKNMMERKIQQKNS